MANGYGTSPGQVGSYLAFERARKARKAWPRWKRWGWTLGVALLLVGFWLLSNLVLALFD